MKSSMSAPYNLLLHPDGTFSCKDGQDPKEYLAEFMKTSWNKAEPVPVNLLSNKWYSELEFAYQLNSCA